MDREFVMPMLGTEIEEGVVRSWMKGVGDAVREGELVAVIGTTKLDMEIECPFTGTIKEIVTGVDEVAPVGGVLAIVTTEA